MKMKLIHLSDLHIGKRINGFSMLDDQQYILTQILGIIYEQKPDGVIIAGDIYDKTVPPSEAVRIFDDFLVSLSQHGIKVFVISGNHDSAERVAFGGRLMTLSGVYVSPVYCGKIDPVTLTDEYGELNIYMLPFIKPAHVRALFPDNETVTYTDAVKAALSDLDIDTSKRNVLVTHQFVTGATRCDSEEISVGGTDNVDADVFSNFDYTALGHLHGPQNIRENIRYCGTPLKYSFSECAHKKSVTVCEFRSKGDLKISSVPLVPLHDMREIKGTYNNLTSRDFYSGSDTADYLHVTLTDEEDIPDAVNKLRAIYPNLMRLDYDNTRTRANGTVTAVSDIDTKTPFELFSKFYTQQNGREMTAEQAEYIRLVIKNIWDSEDDI